MILKLLMINIVNELIEIRRQGKRENRGNKIKSMN